MCHGPFTLITDCCDDNAVGRVTARLRALLPNAVIGPSIGVHCDLEAGFNILGQLDALTPPGMYAASAVMLVNVAPRDGGAKHRPNGSPFGHFTIGKCHIFSTVDGFTLSIVKKFFPDIRVKVYDVATVVRELGLAPSDQVVITTSQFRSYTFLPILAKAVLSGRELSSEVLQGNDVAGAPAACCHVDCFGNSVTTILPEEVGFVPGRQCQVAVDGGQTVILPCYDYLSQVKHGELAVIIGSSGFRRRRLLQIVVKGGNAAARLGLRPGIGITIKEAA